MKDRCVHFVYLQNMALLTGFILYYISSINFLPPAEQGMLLYFSRVETRETQIFCQLSMPGHSRGSCCWGGRLWTSWSCSVHRWPDQGHRCARQWLHRSQPNLQQPRNLADPPAPVKAIQNKKADLHKISMNDTRLWILAGMLFLNILMSQGGQWETFLSWTPLDENMFLLMIIIS